MFKAGESFLAAIFAAGWRKAGAIVKRAALCLIVLLLAVNSPTAFAQCDKAMLHASDAVANDQFGYSVAMSGNICVVGAHLDDAPALNSGSAYVFRYDPFASTWIQEAKLTAADGAAGDEFGYSVAVFSNAPGGIFGGGGDIVVVGSRMDDDHGGDSGSAYVFQHTGSNWVQVAKLVPSDGAAADHYGHAVAISGNFLMVSARDDDAPTTNSGSVYAYHWNGSNWTQQAKLMASDAAANDQFGQALAMTSAEGGAAAVAIITAWHDDSPAVDSGSAYIFRFKVKSGVWAEGAKLTAADGATNDEFGTAASIAVSLDGEVALVGARNDDDGGINTGSAYVFRHIGNSWIQEAKLNAINAVANDQFGYALSLNGVGNAAVIGAWHNDQAGLDAGAAYVFHYQSQSGAWPQAAMLVGPHTLAGDLFGSAIAASGDRAVIGGYQNDGSGTDSGAVDMFAGISGADANSNGIPDGCDLPGDVDGDGVVNNLDLIAVLGAWGACPPPPDACPADLDGDGYVDVSDLLIVISHWS